MSDAHLIILHAGKYGQTRKVAERIADRLREAGAVVDVADLRAAPPATIDAYDAVVIGGAVHAGNHLRAQERWMRSHAEALSAGPSAVFSVSLSASDEGGPGQADATQHLEELLTRTGVAPTKRTVIAGALAYRDYNRLIRWMMRRLARRKGLPVDTSRNVELTDWAAVDAFAATLVDAFGLREPS
jgi:menaquinone-dependent protoporphyrinogen oxidase